MTRNPTVFVLRNDDKTAGECRVALIFLPLLRNGTNFGGSLILNKYYFTFKPKGEEERDHKTFVSKYPYFIRTYLAD